MRHLYTFFHHYVFVCYCLPNFSQSALMPVPVPIPVPVSCSNSPNLVYRVVHLGFCLTSFYLVKPWPRSSRLQSFCQSLPLLPVISQSLSLFLHSQDKLIFSLTTTSLSSYFVLQPSSFKVLAALSPVSHWFICQVSHCLLRRKAFPEILHLSHLVIWLPPFTDHVMDCILSILKIQYINRSFSNKCK